MAKFKKGDRIYPNLEAMDTSMPYGHSHGMYRKDDSWNWCSKAERIERAVTVRAAGKKYLLGFEGHLAGTRYDVAWVDAHFRSESEHIRYCIDTWCDVGQGKERRTAVRTSLLEVAERLTIEVSAFRPGSAYEVKAFDCLLGAWVRCGYRPTLSMRDPKAADLANIYDFEMRLAGRPVRAFRSNG